MREKMLARLKEKMGDSKMSPEYKDAKKGMLESLIKHMSSMGGDKLKKVSVMSDSEQGLEKGLDKAKEILARGVPGGHDEFKETAEDEAMESPEMQKMEDETGTEMHNNEEMQDGPSLTPENEEDIDRQIAELMAKKQMIRK